MRVLAESFDVLNMLPGDSFSLEYNVPGQPTRTVLRRDLDRQMRIDYQAVIEFDESELKRLGLTDAIAGVFGVKIDNA